MTRRNEALAYLSRHAGAWMRATDLIEAGAGLRYAARIAELREAGYDIEGRMVEGHYCYRLNVPGQATLFGEVAA